MTKRVNWLPNERVDVLDMTDGTTTLSVGVSTQLVQRALLDHFARIANGFRVEIANQGTSPGQFTIWNGVGFDRFGQILQNEDEENTQRSVTLLANGQYFVEVAFTAPASDTDARAFWDPTVDNGTDPSGDPREPGKEFGQNVATRLSPDWQVVTPVSTTGFQITANPNSLRVPVAVIQVAGGVIVGGSTVVARTTLDNPAIIGQTTIKVFDSRLFPDTFNANLAVEAITVTANDRVNGVLTLGVALGSNHSPGDRLVITGAGLSQFLVEAAQVQTLPTAGTVDARPRLFQGNPERGNALAQDPGAATGRSAVQLQTLKDQVDFLSAQIREMRFGAERASDIGLIGPPTAFPATPNYWDVGGGLTGARCNSVSIGDGVVSWGDFNLSKFANATALFNAAIAALPAAGGTIFVKHIGTAYNFSGGVCTITSQKVKIVAEVEGTILHAEGATAVFSLQAATLELVGFNVVRDGGATVAAVINYDTAALVPSSLSTRNCLIEGVNTATVSILTNCIFERTTFTSNGGNHIGFRGDTTRSSFVNCNFDGSLDANAATRCMALGVNGTTSTVFTNCVFTGGNGAAQAIDLITTTDVKFSRCDIAFTPAAQIGIVATAGSSTRLTFDDVQCAEQLGMLSIDESVDLMVRNCVITNISNNGNSGIRLGVGGNSNVHIKDCRFAQNGVTGLVNKIIWVQQANGLHIHDCRFEHADACVWVENAEEVFITDCEVTIPAGAFGRYFFVSTASLTNATIRDNKVFGLNDNSGGEIIPIKCRGVCFNVHILHNEISTIGNVGTNLTMGIISVQASAGNGDDIHIIGNEIDTIQNITPHNCIEVWTSARRVIIANNIIIPTLTRSTGIQVSDNAQNNAIQEIAITGNIIGHASVGSCNGGISILMTSSASQNEGLITVNGNTVRGWDFNSVGIAITGSASLAIAATVANNVLQNSDAATMVAIDVASMRTATVSGNVIEFPDTGNLTTKLGLIVVSCQNIAVTGNVCRVGHQDGHTFRIDTCLRGAVTGNVIECAGVSGTAVGIIVINVGPQVFVAGNSVWGFAGAGSGAIAGVNRVALARSDVDNNAGAVPGGFGDVGLNLRM